MRWCVWCSGSIGVFWSSSLGQLIRRPRQPAFPTRLMAGLHILKYSENLSDERLCEVWAENPYYQYFCGEEFFQHKLVFDRSSMTRWRQRMGEESLKTLLQESLSVAVKTKALKPSELTAVVVDTTVRRRTWRIHGRQASKPRQGDGCAPCAKSMALSCVSPMRAWATRAYQTAALRPRETVQAREQILKNAQDLSRPGDARIRRKIAASETMKDGLRPPLILGLQGADQKKRQEAPKVDACTRPRWSASAKARHTSPTSSA